MHGARPSLCYPRPRGTAALSRCTSLAGQAGRPARARVTSASTDAAGWLASWARARTPASFRPLIGSGLRSSGDGRTDRSIDRCSLCPLLARWSAGQSRRCMQPGMHDGCAEASVSVVSQASSSVQRSITCTCTTTCDMLLHTLVAASTFLLPSSATCMLQRARRMGWDGTPPRLVGSIPTREGLFSIGFC